MCSFLFARTRRALSDEVVRESNHFAKQRGPDRCTVHREADVHGLQLLFLHNLLDISGTAACQPIVDDHDQSRIVSLFNGEIYNFKELGEFRCDTECIVPAYRRSGPEIGRIFDGEFSIVIYDSASNCLTILVDPFLTKPLYIGRGSDPAEIGVGTCGSSLRSLGFEHVAVMEPNTSVQLSLGRVDVTETLRSESFSFSIEQSVETYSAWCEAFIEAVRKRAVHGAHKPVVFLSSGYDSGAICLALNLLKVPYDTLSIVAGEAESVLRARISLNRQASCERAFCVHGLSPSELQNLALDIDQYVEPVAYMHEDAPGVVTRIQDDGGALGSNFLAGMARRMDRVVNLSGAGADEILSDYGFNGEKLYYHSEFGGLFPQDLSELFPWKKFYGDTQRSYLLKEEFVLGRHGVEGRYPFLDREVVQQFLSLSAPLKNLRYKAPVDAFLSDAGYPFERAKKRGFAPSSQRNSLWQMLRAIASGKR